MQMYKKSITGSRTQSEAGEIPALYLSNRDINEKEYATGAKLREGSSVGYKDQVGRPVLLIQSSEVSAGFDTGRYLLI